MNNYATFELSTLKAITLFAAKTDIRKQFMGVAVSRNNGIARISATTGHVLATSTTSLDSAGGFEIIVPIETIDLILKMKIAAVTIDADNKTIAGVPFTPLDYKFPDCERVWPKPKEYKSDYVVINPDYYGLIAKAAKAQKLTFVNSMITPVEKGIVFEIGAIRGYIMLMNGMLSTVIPSF